MSRGKAGLLEKNISSCREKIREKQRGRAHLGNSLRIPSPVSVAYTAPALIWFATRPALPRSADITVDARPGHRTGLLSGSDIREADISRAGGRILAVRLRLIFKRQRSFQEQRKQHRITDSLLPNSPDRLCRQRQGAGQRYRMVCCWPRRPLPPRR